MLNNNLLLTEREGRTGTGTRTMLVLSLPALENKNYTAYDRFHGNGPYGEISTKKEPIRTLGFTLPYNKGYVLNFIFKFIFVFLYIAISLVFLLIRQSMWKNS